MQSLHPLLPRLCRYHQARSATVGSVSECVVRSATYTTRTCSITVSQFACRACLSSCRFSSSTRPRARWEARRPDPVPAGLNTWLAAMLEKLRVVAVARILPPGATVYLPAQEGGAARRGIRSGGRPPARRGAGRQTPAHAPRAERRPLARKAAPRSRIRRCRSRLAAATRWQ